jgi:hypothetical protein
MAQPELPVDPPSSYYDCDCCENVEPLAIEIAPVEEMSFCELMAELKQAIDAINKLLKKSCQQ